MSDEHRIFAYHDGRCEVFADPLVVLGQLTELLGGSPNAVLDERRQKQNPLVAELSRRQIVAASRAAFEMAPFDRLTGEGALDEDCEKVLDDFLAWLDAKKKPTASPPISAPSTAPRSTLVPGLSPTKPSSDCGCS